MLEILIDIKLLENSCTNGLIQQEKK